MITVKSAKKTLTGNFEINGYCLMEDEKPTENIANGSKLWELNSGDRYVFDEENTEWIKLKSGGSQNVNNLQYFKFEGTVDDLTSESGNLDNLQTIFDEVENIEVGILTLSLGNTSIKLKWNQDSGFFDTVALTIPLEASVNSWYTIQAEVVTWPDKAIVDCNYSYVTAVVQNNGTTIQLTQMTVTAYLQSMNMTPQDIQTTLELYVKSE